MIINRIFSCNNLFIVNGRRTVNDVEVGDLQKFDRRKSADCSDIDKISVISDVDVNISVSNSSKVAARFHGEAKFDGDVNFDVLMLNHELRITLQLTGSCKASYLRLDITVPKKTFKVISATSSYADITLNEGVSTKSLKINTQSGDLETTSTFTNAFISTMSGDVELYIDAIHDISVDISTMSGDMKIR